MTFCVYTIWYNDPSIIRMIESIPDYIPIIIIDGGFNGGLSPNEMREKIKSYKNTVLFELESNEVDKRNIGLKLCSGFKYVMMMDSDEYVKKCNWAEFIYRLNSLESGHHYILLEDLGRIEDGKARISAYGRIFVNPDEWEYVECYDILRNRKTNIIKPSHMIGGEFLEEMLLCQDDTMRSSEYLTIHEKYINDLILKESVLRSNYEPPVNNAITEGYRNSR